MSKITPLIILDILFLCASSPINISLLQACNEIGFKYGITLNKQSLDERFGEASMSFIRSLLLSFLGQQVTAVFWNQQFLKKFNHIRVADSTKFDVPKEFKEILSGFNGKPSSASGVSIQYEFDLKSGGVLSLDIDSATSSDSVFAGKAMDCICKGDLVIRDLGYYSKKNLIGIESREAFFISRLNAKTKVYAQDKNEELIEVSFGKLYQEMSQQKVDKKELQVYIGNDKKLRSRLMVQIVPDEVYSKRVAKLNKYNKANGHQTSQDIKDRYRFNLFVTNIAPEDIDMEQIYLLYKLRWQIELTFKTWKSDFKLASLQKMKYHRYMTILYAKLLLILINQQIVLSIRHSLFVATKKTLSLIKGFKTLCQQDGLMRELLDKPKSSANVFEKLVPILKKNHWLETRKNKAGLKEIMDFIDCISVYYEYI
ncbi:MAG: hypothetical protein CVV49_21820 [Spirochaetae bacterium HGW-Spirochaetae-5]|jgi:hypothetical protein|nr:MAG: hypothetical protein CVV49_21820 [Spirochaetae bacterium HGW-Spirochaetae-5]PKP46701.1 MAG: hypothetical protein CVT92_17375 [Bacteroidetes bacterium HGW-Bacteroidetes-1]